MIHNNEQSRDVRLLKKQQSSKPKRRVSKPIELQEQKWLRAKAAAIYLQCGESTLWYWVKHGKLKSYKKSIRVTLFAKKDLDEMCYSASNENIPSPVIEKNTNDTKKRVVKQKKKILLNNNSITSHISKQSIENKDNIPTDASMINDFLSTKMMIRKKKPINYIERALKSKNPTARRKVGIGTNIEDKTIKYTGNKKNVSTRKRA